MESIYTRRRQRGTWPDGAAGYYTLDRCRNLFTKRAVNAAAAAAAAGAARDETSSLEESIRLQTLQATIQTNQPDWGLAVLLHCDHLGTDLEVHLKLREEGRGEGVKGVHCSMSSISCSDLAADWSGGMSAYFRRA